METKDIVTLLENNDALGFTKFLKEALATETASQLTEGALTPIMPCAADCTEVHNHHKAEETAAGRKAGLATSKTTSTDPKKEDNDDWAKGIAIQAKVMEAKIQEHKDAASKALTESNLAEAMVQLEAAKKLEEEVVANKHKAEEIAAGEKAGDATSKTTSTSAKKPATPKMKDGVPEC